MCDRGGDADGVAALDDEAEVDEIGDGDDMGWNEIKCEVGSTASENCLLSRLSTVSVNAPMLFLSSVTSLTDSSSITVTDMLVDVLYKELTLLKPTIIMLLNTFSPIQ